MDLVWTLLGIALIALALRDVFDVLFHPRGRGVVARRVVLAVTWASRNLVPRARATRLLSGPLSYIAVVATWAALLAVGWALVFLPHLPEGFTFDPGLDPRQNSGFADALYVSLVNLTSLGYGDISPASSLLRLLGPLETMFGLGLLTASLSWLISIYSSISRPRLARPRGPPRQAGGGAAGGEARRRRPGAAGAAPRLVRRAADRQPPRPDPLPDRPLLPHRGRRARPLQHAALPRLAGRGGE